MRPALPLAGDEPPLGLLAPAAHGAHQGARVQEAFQQRSRFVEQTSRETGANGFNAATGEFEDLVKAGVIDPAKVTRAALQNASSIAAMLLTTEALVADKPEPPAPAMPGGGGMDPMGGMGGMGGMM